MRDFSTLTKRTIKVITILLFMLGLSVGIVHSYSSGPPPGVSGVPAGGGFPAEMTCNQSECHEGNRVNPDNRGKIGITGMPDNYLPGQRYSLMFTISQPDPDRMRWGFQVTAVSAHSYTAAGDLEVSDRRNTARVVDGLTHRQYISHGALGTGLGRSGGFSWMFDWVAPSTNVGDVAFYGSGNASNGDGSNDGDKIYNPMPNPVALTKGQFTFTNIAGPANVTTGSGPGVAVGDFDKDGDADLFVAGASYTLYRNNSDGTFTDVTMSTGLTAGGAQGQAAAWGDYDGDGDADLFVVNTTADRLYRNNGDGTFTDVTANAGISDGMVGHAVAWADFTGDNRLDLYVANEGQDALYVNNMNGTFTKADPAVAGIVETAASWGVAVADYNGDGKLDIFVANDGPSALYKNNGTGTFTDVTTMAGIQTATTQSRAAAWIDYDKDGDQDLFIAKVGADQLYKNNGNGTFTDGTTAAGVADMATAAAVAVGDYDKDGDADLFVANVGQDFLYRNNGNGTFNQVAAASGMTDTAAGQAAVWLDTNGDGNPDLFVANAEGGNFLYRNPGKGGPPAANTLATDSLVTRIMMLVTRLIG